MMKVARLKFDLKYQPPYGEQVSLEHKLRLAIQRIARSMAPGVSLKSINFLIIPTGQ